MSIFRTFSTAASRPFFTPPITGINNPNYYELIKTFPDGMNDGKTLWISEDNSIVYEGGYKWTLTNGVYVNTNNTSVDVDAITFDGNFSINILVQNVITGNGSGGSYDGTAQFLQRNQAGNWEVYQSFPFQAKLFPSFGPSRYFISSSGGTATFLYYLNRQLGNDNPILTYYKKINGSWVALKTEDNNTQNKIFLGQITYSGDGDTIATTDSGTVSIYKYNGNLLAPFTQTANFVPFTGGGIVAIYLNNDGTVLLTVKRVLLSSNSSGSTYEMQYKAYGLVSETWQQLGAPITFEILHLPGEYTFPNGRLLSEDGTKFITVQSANGVDRTVKIYRWNGTAWLSLGSGITGNRIGSCVFFNESAGRLSISKDRFYTPIQQYVYVQ